MNRWAEFYTPFFSTEEETNTFVSRCQAQVPPNHQAKLMMHQVRRLVTIADDMPKIRKDRESLQLLFLIICAENVAKLADGYNLEGRSKHYVKIFFEDFISDEDRDLIESSFTDHDCTPLDLGTVIDHLYTVRCDVVHEGNYWEFTFKHGSIDMVNTRQQIQVRMTYLEFRDVVVRTAISTIEHNLVGSHGSSV